MGDPGVVAKLSVAGSEPIDATVRVERGAADRGPRLVLALEGGTRWTVEFDAGPAAYVAGRLTVAAGVVLGEPALEPDPRKEH
jgi:hypothetical protein